MTAVLGAPPSPRETDPLPGATSTWAPGRVVVVLSFVCLLAVLVAALLVGGGAPAPALAGLPDAGAVVGWGQPVVSLLTRLLSVVVVGSLLVAAFLRPAPGGVLPKDSRNAVRTAAAAAMAWAVCEVAGLVLLTGSLLGRPIPRLVPGDLVAVATGLPAGRTALAILTLLAALVLVAVAAAGARSTGVVQARVMLLTALAGVVLPVVTTGHSAASHDHLATVSTLAVHVVAASLWTGGLLGVLLHLRGAGSDRAEAVRRLSRLALACVVAVTATGVVGAVLITDVALPVLLMSGYGALLLVKTAAVALLVWAGWVHRRRTLALLRTGRRGAFVRLAVLESALMAATLAVAVGLSVAPPPAGPPVEAPAADGPQAPTSGTPGTDIAEADDPVDTGASDTAAAEPPVEDMRRHDHGELSVAVLVDDERLHVGAPVRPGAPVTVYNVGTEEVILRAEDGSFDSLVPSRTFITFIAPHEPGGYAFGDPRDERYADVLQVVPPQG